MELRQLRYFLAVAEELHFTKAAERLCIGQPPLSYTILQLEEELGVRLFLRTKRSVQLTDAGRHLMKNAYELLQLADQTKRLAQQLSNGEIGELNIGFTSSTPLTELFSDLIQKHRQAFPSVRLIFKELSTAKQLLALEKGELDLGFLRPDFSNNLGASTLAQCSFIPLRTDSLMVALPTGHALLSSEEIYLKDLMHESFIMYPASAGTSIYKQINILCANSGFVPNVVQEASEASTLIGLVAAGIGITILPASFDRIQLAGVSYRPLKDTQAKTSLLLAHQTSLLPAARATLIAQFIALATTHATQPHFLPMPNLNKETQ